MNLRLANKLLFLAVICLFTLAACGKAKDGTDTNAEDNGDTSGQSNNITITAAPTAADNNDTSSQSKNITVTAAPTATDNNDDKQTEDSSEKDTKTYMENYESTGELPSLAEIYKDKFKVGVALSSSDLVNAFKKQLLPTQFNSITCENEMKPDFVLDREETLKAGDEECPAINMKSAKNALEFAKNNNMQIRMHTLVWHSQTPRWFFTVGYDSDNDAPYVTREVMLVRLENYIRLVMEYLNTNYPGVVYAYDVVNEAIEPADGRDDGIRVKGNKWFEVIGPDYIEMAFTYARKYAAPEQKLFYNDYNTYEKNKIYLISNMAAKLQEKGLIDGIGMQDHMQVSYPSVLDYQYAINKYTKLGLELQVTELDINTTDNTEAGQIKLANKYKNVMMTILNCIDKNNAKITSVTFWGLTDDRSWLNKPGQPNYPLLFDKDLKPKLAYFGVVMDKSIRGY